MQSRVPLGPGKLHVVVLVEEGVMSEDERITENLNSGEEIKPRYLETLRKYASYQKEFSTLQSASQNTSENTAILEAVKRRSKNNGRKYGIKTARKCLERLPAPSWDGSRKAYLTWKKEFQHWMKKHGQDKDEQLQRFRKAIPKGSWWTEQLKTCKNIDRAWEILDIEFADKRKLMDELLAEIDNYGTVKGDSKSLGRFATSVLVFVSDMEDNGCPV